MQLVVSIMDEGLSFARSPKIGADAVLVGQHDPCRSADYVANRELAGHRFFGGVQSTLPRNLDRLHLPDHARRSSAGLWISLDRSYLLLGRHRDWSPRGVGAQTFGLQGHRNEYLKFTEE
jgi:hypothetical protein